MSDAAKLDTWLVVDGPKRDPYRRLSLERLGLDKSTFVAAIRRGEIGEIFAELREYLGIDDLRNNLRNITLADLRKYLQRNDTSKNVALGLAVLALVCETLLPVG